MTLIVDYPLTSTFLGVNSLQAQGQILAGSVAPNGIGTSLYFEDDAMVSYINQADTATAGGIRSEITAPADAFAERWYTWDFMIPTSSAPVTDAIILMQIHDTPDGGDPARAVPFSLLYNQPGYLAAYVPAATLPTEGANSTMIGMVNLNKGEWYSACLHALWSTTATGYRELFINRMPVFRQFNLATMYSDVTGPYFKCGCYDGTSNARFAAAKAYYRNVKIYSGNDGYEEVMGGLPELPPQVMES